MTLIQPKPIGRFLQCDNQGFVIPDVSATLITGQWRSLVDDVTTRLVQGGAKSVYIRGSIPRGLAIENSSDADFIYFSKDKNEELEKEITDQVKNKFAFLRGLELFRIDEAQFSKVFPGQERPYLQMLLKTQSLFLSGDHLTATIAPFKIGAEMVSHAFVLAHEFSKLPIWLQEDQKTGDEIETRRWFSRRVVRAGLEITMDRSPYFTRDLYLCYEKFSQFYPQYQKEMYEVLVNALNGNMDPLQYEQLVHFLDQEAKKNFKLI